MGVEILGYKLIDDDGLFSFKLVREVLAELIGTFYLIILGTGGKESDNHDLDDRKIKKLWDHDFIIKDRSFKMAL